MNLFPRYSLHDDDDRLVDDPAAREAYDRLWELNAHVAEPFARILNEWAGSFGKAKPADVPYPEFCRHPDKCAGRSTCPRDPCCAD